MLKIGITGQKGFVGSHLYNTLSLAPKLFRIVEFEKMYFNNKKKLNNFVSECDVIIHLAALNRHHNSLVIYKTNIDLVEKLIASLKKSKSKTHVIMSSSSQENRDNKYGKSKKEGRLLLSKWALENDEIFTGMIVPNVFGPFGEPFYNSVVATFSHQVVNNEKPVIKVDGELKLIYVGELISEIISIINKKENSPKKIINETSKIKVSDILKLLVGYKKNYQERGEIPQISNMFELNLFNTYRSFINIKKFFPVKYRQHTDDRGTFVEIIRLGIGGQVSFSTTVPGISRGNHFHTRKIERFSVIKGKALIQLRKIGSDNIIELYLEGNKPAYVDIPIWYTHNITNIGDTELITIFWINEPYNSKDADTYFVKV